RRSSSRDRRANIRAGERALGWSDTSAAKQTRRSVTGRSHRCDSLESAVTGIAMTKTVLGVIGGSRLYAPPGPQKGRHAAITRPWGGPSAPPPPGHGASTL